MILVMGTEIRVLPLQNLYVLYTRDGTGR